MKAVVSKLELVNLTNKLQGLIAAKPAIPILANVLVEASGDQIILSATDLTTSMRCYADAKVIEEGAIALPARRLFSLIRELTSPQIKISVEKTDIAEIASGSSIFKINGVPKNAFPMLPAFSGSASVLFDPTNLKDILAKVAVSAARDDNRIVLNGIHLQIANKKAIFISTDAKRLCKITVDVDIDPSFLSSYVIPIKAAEEMSKMLDETSKKATLSLMHDKIFLENGSSTLATKLIAGQYPDIGRVLPEPLQNPITIHREELTALLKQVALFTSEENTTIRFIFDKGELQLNAASNKIGEGQVSMPVDYHKTRIEAAFNPFYFLDIFRHIKDETVNLFVTDTFDPGIITDSSNGIFMIMPMRLNQNPEHINLNASENSAFA
jgi:DNA polymerase-3 subunit beta